MGMRQVPNHRRNVDAAPPVLNAHTLSIRLARKTTHGLHLTTYRENLFGGMPKTIRLGDFLQLPPVVGDFLRLPPY